MFVMKDVKISVVPSRKLPYTHTFLQPISYIGMVELVDIIHY